MDGDRTVRVWGLVCDYAVARGAVVSANHVCESCVTALGVGGAALALTDGSGLRETVYVTDPLSARLEEEQLALGEGPSVAFGLPRWYARSHNRRLSDLAHGLVDRSEDVADLAETLRSSGIPKA